MPSETSLRRVGQVPLSRTLSIRLDQTLGNSLRWNAGVEESRTI